MPDRELLSDSDRKICADAVTRVVDEELKRAEKKLGKARAMYAKAEAWRDRFRSIMVEADELAKRGFVRFANTFLWFGLGIGIGVVIGLALA